MLPQQRAHLTSWLVSILTIPRSPGPPPPRARRGEVTLFPDISQTRPESYSGVADAMSSIIKEEGLPMLFQDFYLLTPCPCFYLLTPCPCSHPCRRIFRPVALHPDASQTTALHPIHTASHPIPSRRPFACRAQARPDSDTLCTASRSTLDTNSSSALSYLWLVLRWSWCYTPPSHRPCPPVASAHRSSAGIHRLRPF